MAGFPNSQSNPAGAIPVYTAPAPGGGSFASYSGGLIPGSPGDLPANPNRRYLFIQALDATAEVYFMVLPTTQIPSRTEEGSYVIPAGGSYESGPVVPTGPLTINVSIATLVTVIEG